MNNLAVWSLTGFSIIMLGAIIYLLIKDKAAQNLERSEQETGLINVGIIDYNTYSMSGKERYLCVLSAGIAVFAVGYILYRSITLAALITPLALYYPKVRIRDNIRKQKNELNIQFKEALYSLSSSLSAGKAIETAFMDALKDLSILYPNPETYIIKEFQYIVRKLDMNETVESALEDFAGRAHIEDITNFVDVFKTCKRTGGNLVQVMKNTSDIINDKISIKQEIATMLSQRKFEQKVLNLVPIGMIFLLSANAEDFMKPMYTEIRGRIVMSVAALILLAAYFISNKIMDIKV